jgi:hypothetical protein
MTTATDTEWKTVRVLGGVNDGLRVGVRRDEDGLPVTNVPGIFIPHGTSHYRLDENLRTLTCPPGFEQ